MTLHDVGAHTSASSIATIQARKQLAYCAHEQLAHFCTVLGFPKRNLAKLAEHLDKFIAWFRNHRIEVPKEDALTLLGYITKAEKRFAALGSLKRKGFVRWSAKPKHPNEYILPFGGSGGAGAYGMDGEDSPAPNDGTIVEGAACTLAQSFAALLADRKRRFAASLDYTKPEYAASKIGKLATK